MCGPPEQKKRRRRLYTLRRRPRCFPRHIYNKTKKKSSYKHLKKPPSSSFWWKTLFQIFPPILNFSRLRLMMFPLFIYYYLFLAFKKKSSCLLGRQEISLSSRPYINLHFIFFSVIYQLIVALYTASSISCEKLYITYRRRRRKRDRHRTRHSA